MTPEMTTEEWAEMTKKLVEDDLSDEAYDEEEGKLYGGILPLGSQGCTYLHGLILNGPHCGKVVNLDQDFQKPIFSHEADFLDWYERWLDEVISGDLLNESAGWFGYTKKASADQQSEETSSPSNKKWYEFWK